MYHKFAVSEQFIVSLKMATKNKIATCFQELNIMASDVVLERCVEMCLKYDIEAEDFCDQWYAYTASHLNGAAPTVEYLEKLERKEFQRSKDQFNKRSVATSKTASNRINDDTEGSSMVSSHTATPKSSTKQNPTTKISRDSDPVIDSFVNDPSSSNPVSLSERYTKRLDSRSVQCSYGSSSAKNEREINSPVVIKNANGEPMSDNVKYMYEIMGKKAKCLNNMAQSLGHAILKKHHLTLTEGTLKNYLGDMVTYGRITSDRDGKINAHSILFEGTLETSLGNTVNLNLNKVSKFSLFPGQVAVVQGNNPNSSTFIAENVFTDAILPLPSEPPLINDQLQIVVASGPYTLQNNLMFEPLKDLLKYVCEYKPQVLILIGPLLERNHECILNGSLLETLDSFFESLIENIMNSLKDTNTQVIIVSSQNEAHFHPVYPTPPYSIKDKYTNLTFFSDPCMVNINGLVIGATSADILFHIGKFEIYLDKNPVSIPDRMARLASHVLSQRNFYPLYPPHKDICQDHELFEQYGVMECKPHILILPSNLRHFIKNVQDCIVINPERLTNGYVAGTFAKIQVYPGVSHSICDRTVCEIIRV